MAQRARTFSESSWTRRERGAAAVEFALVGSLLLLLLFGIVDGGIAANNVQAVRHGSAEGARQGAVARTGADAGCSLQGAAAGASLSTQQLICLTKSRTHLDADDVRVMVAFGIDGYVSGGRLLVCVQYPLRSWSGMLAPWLNDKVARSKGTTRIDRLGAPPLQAVAEPAPDEGDWSWCTA